MEYCNGDMYKGEWQLDRRHGTGSLFFAQPQGAGSDEESRDCTGEWRNDVFFAGKGTVRIQSATEGGFVDVKGTWKNGVCLPDPDQRRPSNQVIMKRVLELLEADGEPTAHQEGRLPSPPSCAGLPAASDREEGEIRPAPAQGATQESEVAIFLSTCSAKRARA